MTDRSSDASGTPDTNLSTEHQKSGDALHPSDRLDKDQVTSGDAAETIHRRSSLTEDK